MAMMVTGWIATGLGIGVGTVGGAIISTGVAIAIQYAASRIFAPKGPAPREAKTEMRQADAPRIRYLGRNRVAGAVMYWEVRQGALWKLLALAQGGMNSVQQVYCGEERITVTAGSVTSGAMAGRANLWRRLGLGSEVSGGDYPQLRAASPEWTQDHRLDGIGTVLCRFPRVSAEDANQVYPGGDPQISCVIEGDSQIHPGTAPTEPSHNLARQLYDILCNPEWGIMEPAHMDAASWQQAITDCNDEMPGLEGPQPRYHGGGGYYLSEPVKDVAARWLEAMAGQIFLTAEGRLGLRVGKWRAPRHTITEDHIVSMEYGTGSTRVSPVSTLVPKYTAAALGYTDATADPWEDAAAIARWGEPSRKEMPLPLVHHHGHARRLAKIKMARMNPRWRFTLRLRFWGLLLMDEHVVRLTIPRLGIVDQPFWIESYHFDPAASDGVCAVELAHADPASFDWTASEEGAAPANPPRTGGDMALPAPVITSAEVVADDGLYIRAGYVVAAGVSVVGQYRLHGSSQPWTYMQAEGAGGTLRTLPLEDGRRYDIRLAASRGYGRAGAGAEWVRRDDILVVRDQTPPAPPSVVQKSGAAGQTMHVRFRPDLGGSYRLTRLHRAPRGGSFADAVPVNSSRAMSQEVTLSHAVPDDGGRYYLTSENASGIASAETFVKQY